MGYVVGIDIGGTKCSVILAYADTKINIIEKVKFDTKPAAKPDIIINKFCEIIDGFINKLENNHFCTDTYVKEMQSEEMLTEFVKAHETKPIKSIGISCGGPLNSKAGIIKRPPNLPLWDDVPICKILNNRYNIPVRLQNDANACALAEWKYGAGKGFENIIFLTFGTGLGAGLILNGRLYAGTNDMAGEIGHISLSKFGPSGYGKVGSFEGFCSGSGLAQLGYTMGIAAHQNGETPSYFDPIIAPQGITAKSIGDAAQDGDKTAIKVYELCGKYLGEGLSILIDVLNPQLIIIGSIFERSENLIRASMQDEIDDKALALSKNACKIVPSILKEDIGDYAAITVAIY